MRKVAICGVGKAFLRYFDNYKMWSGDEIVCFVDKNPQIDKLPDEYKTVEFGTYDILKNRDIDLFIIGSTRQYKEVLLSIKSVVGQEINVMSIGEYTLIENPYGRQAKVKEVWSTIPSIPGTALSEAKVIFNRASALDLLPKGGVVAEVGVATGTFSKLILDTMNPSKFYAIDIFSDKTEGFWEIKFDKKRHFEWYRDAFKQYIDKDILEMKKGLSWEVLEQFPNESFDYIYLDGAHDYESVLRDVDVIKRKIKVGGVIQFNDYLIYGYESHTFMGVEPAVNQLLNDTNSKLVYYCLSGIDFDDVVIKYFP